jgi:hypothetical protein
VLSVSLTVINHCIDHAEGNAEICYELKICFSIMKIVSDESEQNHFSGEACVWTKSSILFFDMQLQ